MPILTLILKYKEWAAVAIILAGLFTWFQVKIYQARKAGEQKIIEEVKKGNENAISKGIEGARDVDTCLARGGMWSLVHEKCVPLRP